MHIIMGGTGHVGSACAKALLAQGQPVTIVTHDAAKAQAPDGAQVAQADLNDPDALRAVFRTGRRAFLLNPPADVSGDTDAEEKRTIACILDALKGSSLEKVVAASTYGAQPGEDCGDLNTLWELEQGLERQDIPFAINRGAYYFSNFDMQVEEMREQGVLNTMLPCDLLLPMVAPGDLGAAAARRLMEPVDAGGLRYVEGPRRHTVAEVAEVFGAALGRPVAVRTAPRAEWEAAYEGMGFSSEAARSYARMTEATISGDFIDPDQAQRGATTLENYVRESSGRHRHRQGEPEEGLGGLGPMTAIDYLPSALIGAVASARSMTPMAALAGAHLAGRGTPGRLWLLDKPLFTWGALAMGLGELFGDKMKSAPDRTVFLGLLARVMSAGIAGGALAPRGREREGAALAVGIAVPMAYATLAARKRAMREIGQTRSGLIEDALIVAAGAAVVAWAVGRR